MIVSFPRYKPLSKTFKYRDLKAGNYLRMVSVKQRKAVNQNVLDETPMG